MCSLAPLSSNGWDHCQIPVLSLHTHVRMARLIRCGCLVIKWAAVKFTNNTHYSTNRCQDFFVPFLSHTCAFSCSKLEGGLDSPNWGMAVANHGCERMVPPLANVVRSVHPVDGWLVNVADLRGEEWRRTRHPQKEATILSVPVTYVLSKYVTSSATRSTSGVLLWR